MFRIKLSTVAKVLDVQRKPQGFIGREAKSLTSFSSNWVLESVVQNKNFQDSSCWYRSSKVLRGNGDNDTWHMWQYALCGPMVVSFGLELAYVEQRAFLKPCLNLSQKKTKAPCPFRPALGYRCSETWYVLITFLFSNFLYVFCHQSLGNHLTLRRSSVSSWLWSALCAEDLGETHMIKAHQDSKLLQNLSKNGEKPLACWMNLDTEWARI